MLTETSLPYGITSRDYLRRALARLEEKSLESIFYAAFELRCGIEARMQEYLEAWNHVPENRKKNWSIPKLGRSIEAAFQLGNSVVRFAVHAGDSDGLLACFYHTPVSKELKSQGEKLGNLLHAAKRPRANDDPWWATVRKDLAEITAALRTANTGTLLGPPLIEPGTGHLMLNSEIPPGHDLASLMEPGYRGRLDVSYPPSLPDPLESEAVFSRLE